jgi:hypothetical protein
MRVGHLLDQVQWLISSECWWDSGLALSVHSIEYESESLRAAYVWHLGIRTIPIIPLQVMEPPGSLYSSPSLFLLYAGLLSWLAVAASCLSSNTIMPSTN